MPSTASARSEPEIPVRERTSRPIRSYLFALTLSSMLPLLMFAGLVVLQHAAAVRAATREQMTTTVRALALAIDRDVAGAQAILSVMPDSPSYAAGDQPAFFRECAGLARGYGARILLLDRETQLFDTSLPLGAALPPAPPIAAQTLDTAKPQVSGYFADPAAGAPMVLVTIPLFRDGHPTNTLAMGLDLDRFAKLLEQQRLPAGWLADIIDRRGTLLARNVSPDRFVGQPALPEFLQQLTPAEGMVEAQSREERRFRLRSPMPRCRAGS